MLPRDWRAAHGDPEVPGPGKSRYRDRQRWCRGKDGREHDWELRVTRVWSWGECMAEFCVACGKHRPGSTFRVYTGPVPDWLARLHGLVR